MTTTLDHRPLDVDACRDLLAREREGRLSYQSGRGHRTVPVHYNVGGDYIVFHTAAYNEIAQYVPGNQVSLDLIRRPRPSSDESPGEGWQVHVVGVAESLDTDPDDDDAEPETWPVGVSSVSLRIPVTEISGTTFRTR